MNYASTIEEISATRRKFKISIPSSVVADAFKSIVQEIQTTAEVRGFRKGKVPTTIVRKFFENDVRNKVINKIVGDSYEHAIKEANLQIVSQPNIEPQTQLSEFEDFKFEALVDVNPMLEIQGYKALNLKTKSVTIGDTEIDESLKTLSKALATYEPIKEAHPATEQDIVVVNSSASCNGELVKSGTKNELRIDLSNDKTQAEFRTNLLGATVGDTKSFTITYPANHDDAEIAGKTVNFTLQLVGLEKEIPYPIDDALAVRLGADSLSTLRRSLLERMTRTEENRKLDTLGEQIVEQLLAQNKFEVPESLIENTIDRHIAEENTHLEKKTQLDPKNAEVRAKYHDQALQSVQAILALGNVARIEGLSVEDNEIGPELISMAQAMGIGAQDLVKKGGRVVIDEARGRVLINKTIKHLVGLNNVDLS